MQAQALSYDGLSLLYWNSGRAKEAETHCRTALDLRNQSIPTVRENWGKMLAKAIRTSQRPALPASAADQETAWHRYYLARSHRHLATILERDRPDEAAVAYRQALVLLNRIHAEFPHMPDFQTDMSLNYVKLSAVLRNADRHSEAVEECRRGLKLLPTSASLRNELAWLLVTCPDENARDPSEALTLARRAVMAPKNGNYRTTLAIVHYRAGDWKAAIQEFDRAMPLRAGGDSFDWFFLAMAHWKLGNRDQAQIWYDRANQWMMQHLPQNRELSRFRDEAALLIGLEP